MYQHMLALMFPIDNSITWSDQRSRERSDQRSESCSDRTSDPQKSLIWIWYWKVTHHQRVKWWFFPAGLYRPTGIFCYLHISIMIHFQPWFVLNSYKCSIYSCINSYKTPIFSCENSYKTPIFSQNPPIKIPIFSRIAAETPATFTPDMHHSTSKNPIYLIVTNLYEPCIGSRCNVALCYCILSHTCSAHKY